MANRVSFAVSATPIETVEDDTTTNHDILASEVGKILGGSGESITLTNYAGTAAAQGFADGAVNYKIASVAAGGSALTGQTNPKFIYIKNTGYKFSNATTLGAASTYCVLVALRVEGWVSAAVAGWCTTTNEGATHYIELAWLQPGQAIVLPLRAGTTTAITDFYSTDDLAVINSDAGLDAEQVSLIARTYLPDGTTTVTAGESLAVEYLMAK